MRNAKLTALLLVPLLSCYAQLELPGVSMTHTLCSGGPCVPGGGATLTLIQVSGVNTFTVDFGDQPLLQPSNQIGPTTLKTSLLLNAGKFHMLTANGSFDQVDSVQLLIAPRASTSPGDDPCPTSANCPVIAAYLKTTDGPADQDLMLKGNGSDLVASIDQTSHQLVLEVKAAGKAPQPALWNADVSMDMSLTSRANFP